MDFLRILEIAAEVVGSASAASLFLRQVLPTLRAYALSTATNADDAAVEAASIALGLLTMLAEGLKKLADTLALNPKKESR